MDFVLDKESMLVYAASFTGGHIGLVQLDIDAGTALPLSVKGDGNNDTGFDVVKSVAYDAERDVPYLLVRDASEFAYYLWRIDSETGAREIISPGPYQSLNPNIRFDAVTARLLIADEGLFVATPGDAEHDVLMALGDAFEFVRLATNPNGSEVVVYARKPDDDFELRLLDLTDNKAVPLPGGSDAAFGPDLEYSHGFDVDWRNRIAYTTSSASVGQLSGKRITAVDLETGYRVIVAMEH